MLNLLGKKLDPTHNVARISPRPLLFLNTTEDQVLLRPFATALHKGAVIKWHETDHTFSDTDLPNIMAILSDFMKQSLLAKDARDK